VEDTVPSPMDMAVQQLPGASEVTAAAETVIHASRGVVAAVAADAAAFNEDEDSDEVVASDEDEDEVVASDEDDEDEDNDEDDEDEDETQALDEDEDALESGPATRDDDQR
jgi:phosphopantothenoylcysteine synthetase/decarboxylase